MNKRLYVEKKEGYQTNASVLLEDLKQTLKIDSLQTLRLIQVYDVLNIKEDFNDDILSLFVDLQTDNVLKKDDLLQLNSFAYAPVTGQFDQKAEYILKGLKLFNVDDVAIETSQMIIINDEVVENDKKKIIDYLVNPIENKLKDLTKEVVYEVDNTIKDVITLDEFIDKDESQIKDVLIEYALSMDIKDILHIQNYFKSIKRNPTITELLALDTYWSDHCRHTTFETHLNNIDFSKSKIKDELEESLKIYLDLREKTNRTNKPMTLMDMASIEARYEKQVGLLNDMEISEEVNACSIEIDVDVDGIDEPWLLMYKNETHNHPTEMEPFGGASTCLGGAIRDPLSGRAYVYQAMRITGAGNICEDVSLTKTNKLPQRVIARTAAKGYSSYGNEIGCGMTFLKEFYNDGYVAKRMELGAVVGAIKKSDVTRKSPEPNDYIIMLGAATGRDGVGAATGSSKVSDTIDTKQAQAEVQKGNASEERKILRLFRNPELTKLIKKANDLGAGGFSVAIGELAPGISIDLDVVETKYPGLNGTDLALSESQERMVVVIDPKDYDRFIELAYQENVPAIKMAEVTANNKLEVSWNNQKIIDIDRSFLDTNGVAQTISPVVTSSNNESIFTSKNYLVNNNLKDSLEKMVQIKEFSDLQALASMFDNTNGRGTVQMSYGGYYQASPAEVSAQKIPVINGITQTVSVLAYGANPKLGLYEPFYAGAYSIIEAVARLVASGIKWQKARLSLQEYFESVTNQPERFGKPVAALLGALQTQRELSLPALGGKDSMSGTYEDIDVPPTIVAFAVATNKTNRMISTEFKEENNYVYALLGHENEKIDYDIVRNNFNLINKLHDENKINACMSIKDGGIANCLINMSFGNNIGIHLTENLSLDKMFYPYYGGFVFSSEKELLDDELILLGTTKKDVIQYQEQVIDIKQLLTLSQKTLADVYSTTYTHLDNQISKEFDFSNLKKINNKQLEETKYSFDKVESPIVYIPTFLSTSTEYDIKKDFDNANAITRVIPFVDCDYQAINNSIDTMVNELDNAHIFVLCGGYSQTDGINGSLKYITSIINNEKIVAAIKRFQARDGLILGIGSGFEVLVKTGLLPYNKVGVPNDDIVLGINDGGQHISKLVQTKILKSNSPWLSNVKKDEVCLQAISHGSGKVMGSINVLEKLFENNQVISQYVDYDKNASMDYRFNPNGSYAAIEGLVSEDGRVLGKMAHAERYEKGNYLNAYGNKYLALASSAVAYFTKK